MALPVFEFSDGSKLVAQQMIEPTPSTPFDDMKEEDLANLVGNLWYDACEEKRPETERLKRNSSYYDGFHYADAWHNRTKPIENQIYRVVETQVANMVIARPRPEIMPSKSMPSDVADRLQEYATWLMEADSFDEAVYLGARDKAIFGWNVWLIAFDYETGMPYPKMVSPFDLYKDPAARNEFEAGYLILGMPVGTSSLRAHYPACASYIEPDNIASPAYEAAIRPWYEFLEGGTGYDSPMIAGSSMVVHPEGETPTQGTALVYAPGEKRDHGTTTFLLQLWIQDHAIEDVTYLGQLQRADGTTLDGQKHIAQRPRTPTGWWQVNMTSQRRILGKPLVLDPAYMGLPIVIDRAKQRTDRFWSMSDVDQCIPMQRGLNSDSAAMDRALDLSSNPPLLADRLSGLRAQLNGGTVQGGEVLDIMRGSDVRYLEYRGPEAKHFERIQARRQMIQAIAGNHDTMEGARPVGVEAASAMRQLDNNALRRLRGQENPAHRARALLLRKLMYASGKKLQPEIAFKATSGDDRAVRGDELTMGFSIRFVPGTGTVEGRQDLEDKALALYDREIIDEEAALDVFQWPNRTKIAARMIQRKLQEKVAMAVAAAQTGGPPGTNGSGGGKSRSREMAGRR